jgi:hypothetical protein
MDGALPFFYSLELSGFVFVEFIPEESGKTGNQDSKCCRVRTVNESIQDDNSTYDADKIAFAL